MIRKGSAKPKIIYVEGFTLQDVESRPNSWATWDEQPSVGAVLQIVNRVVI